MCTFVRHNYGQYIHKKTMIQSTSSMSKNIAIQYSISDEKSYEQKTTILQLFKFKMEYINLIK